MKKTGYILIIIAALLWGGKWYGEYNRYNKPISPVQSTYVKPKPVVTQDPTLLADAQLLGIDASELNLEYTTDFNANVTVSGNSVINAIFYYPNKIGIRPGMDKTNELKSIAHEYLHYQWSRRNRAPTDALMQVYNSNYYLRQRMEPYNQLGIGSDDFIDELNSIECTEYADGSLYYVVLNYCTKYLPNRNVLPSYFR